MTTEKMRINHYFSLLIWGCGILGLAAVSYANSFYGVFHFDDIPGILQFEQVHDLKEAWQYLIQTAWNLNRSFVQLTFAINYVLHGEDLPGWHFVNITLHGINGILLFTVIRQLIIQFPQSYPISSMQRNLVAFAVVGLFIVHPFLTACVNYIVQRYTIMATLGYLLGFYGYLRFCHMIAPQKWFWLGVGLCGFAIGFHSKEIIMTLPLTCWGYELVLIWHNPVNRRKFVQISAGVLLCFAIIACSIMYMRGYFTPSDAGHGFRSSKLWSPWQQFQVQSLVLVHYQQMLILPLSQRMSVDHDFPAPTGSLLDPVAGASIAWHVFLLCCAWKLSRRGRILSAMGIVWFYMTHLLYLIVPTQEIMVDYKAYLLSMGFFFVVVDVVLWLDKKLRQRYWVAGMAVLIILGIAGTWQRNQIFRSELTIWQDALEKYPDSKRALNNVGLAYLHQKQYGQAIDYVEKALSIDLEFIPARDNFHIIMMRLGDDDAAIRRLRSFLLTDEENWLYHYKLGALLTVRHRFEEAEFHYQRVHGLKKESSFIRRQIVVFYMTWAKYLLERGQQEEALQVLQIVKQIEKT